MHVSSTSGNIGRSMMPAPWPARNVTVRPSATASVPSPLGPFIALVSPACVPTRSHAMSTLFGSAGVGAGVPAPHAASLVAPHGVVYTSPCAHAFAYGSSESLHTWHEPGASP